MNLHFSINFVQIVPSNDEESEFFDENHFSHLLNDKNDVQNEKEISEIDGQHPKISPSDQSHVAVENNTFSAGSQNVEQHPGVYESPVSPLHFADSIVSPLK